MKAPIRFRRQAARATKSFVFKAKQTLAGWRLRMIYNEIAVAGMMSCLIALLRFILRQPTDTFFLIANALIFANTPVRLMLNFMKPHPLTQSLWRTLWLEKSFHELLLVGAVIISGHPTLLFYGIYLVKFFVRTLKLVLEHVTPFMEELSVPMREWLLKTIKSEEIGLATALAEIALCPVLFARAIESFDIPVGMAACVSATLYLPHMYLVNDHHRLIWKWANVQYTQLAFDNQDSYGKTMLQALEVFVDYSELCYVAYPAKYLRRVVFDTD